MKDYKLIIKFPQADFEAEVNQALADGYDLVGGVVADHLHGWYCQAVARSASYSVPDQVVTASSDSNEAKTEEEKSVSLTPKKVVDGKKGGRR